MNSIGSFALGVHRLRRRHFDKLGLAVCLRKLLTTLFA